MTYLALLRGINVGGNHKVDMKQLKALLESFGYTHVSTYINSGNVFFDSKKQDVTSLATLLEKELYKTFGFLIPTVVRTKDEILKLATLIPPEWQNDTTQKTDVLFLWPEFDSKESLSLLATTKGIDSIKYFPGSIIWNIQRANYNKSGMHTFIGSTLYKNMTARNVNTVRKLAQLLELR